MIFAAVAAIVLSACSKVETVDVITGSDPVTFGAYTGISATKAVSNTTFGSINTNPLLQGSVGFGVFAYYSDGATNDYVDTPSSNFYPNFMYNQLVEYDTDHWTYNPIKYWPNEYNTTNAIGADVDKLTFFAYAPYVETVGDEGITEFSANNVAGDPTVSFQVPADEKTR